jgi:hypothetical protein
MKDRGPLQATIPKLSGTNVPAAISPNHCSFIFNSIKMTRKRRILINEYALATLHKTEDFKKSIKEADLWTLIT